MACRQRLKHVDRITELEQKMQQGALLVQAHTSEADKSSFACISLAVWAKELSPMKCRWQHKGTLRSNVKLHVWRVGEVEVTVPQT